MDAEISNAPDVSPPRDLAGLRALILARRDRFPKRLAQIAIFALDHPEDFALGTAATIAARAETQPSALVRFAQSLGYQGFSDLQAVFRDNLRGRPPSYETRLAAIGEGDGLSRGAALLSESATAARHSLDALARIDPAALEAAVATLAEAETIHLVAQRRAFPVTAYLAYAFAQLGVRARAATSPFGIEAEELGFATPADRVIAVSFSPYAPATIAQARLLSERGLPIVSITDSAFSPLVPLSAHWFEIAEGDFGGFRSLSGSLAFAMALAIAVAEARRRH
ncbi:MurR/RpiR family transcriptional regulator [Arsenicitalea aurantiaca]|uniref:MurR/RpiR family transcriptional regulator n=1 Tax=Arsenicitalea aurantiaca TaxID=1783274 RepID=A0A433X410_9HYPH|nr:MurR/RpiR family transcriptional regulator [Arsenicitalea aurantiaca]RUT28792.1 MurR/RpiR family transcriptional regulator [Arsenicitalea aurantiaca]